MFAEFMIFIFGQSLYDVLLADYPIILAVFAFLCMNTIFLCFSYFVKNCLEVFR